ncbi:MAG: DUF58 domain-containing protein [Bacteroidetes bacterium]|jgi:uncharacterized protein (DUF58 family)|nr:DUF58 domain-containing protein [Bacteroidota bacterium]
MDLNKETVRIQNLELLAKQVVEGFITGLHKSPYHGFSVEFAEHRQYNSGESTRNIDWKLFARTGRLYVKRFEEETNLRCQLLLDVSSSMFYPNQDENKIKYGVVGAASIMHLLRKQRDAVGLTLFHNSVINHLPAKSSASHHAQLLTELSNSYNHKSVQKTTNVAAVLHEIAERIHKRSLVVIFSDMFDGDNEEALFDALQHLKFNKHEVVLFHIMDHQSEKEFSFADRPYTFEDLESGEKVKLFPSEVKEAYTKQFESFYANLKNKCAQYKIDFVNCDINKPLDQVLLPFLVKRHKMRA